MLSVSLVMLVIRIRVFYYPARLCSGRLYKLAWTLRLTIQASCEKYLVNMVDPVTCLFQRQHVANLALNLTVKYTFWSQCHINAAPKHSHKLTQTESDRATAGIKSLLTYICTDLWLWSLVCIPDWHMHIDDISHHTVRDCTPNFAAPTVQVPVDSNFQPNTV